MGSLTFDYAPLALSFIHVLLGVAVLILAKFALAAMSPYSTDQELTTRDNPAFGLAIAGYYAAVVIIYVGSAAAPLPVEAGSAAAWRAIAGDAVWAIAGIVALNLSRWLLDRFLVTGVRNDREITEHRNLAAGAAECAGYLSTGLILAGSIRQPGGTPWTALALFVIGQCALILMGHVYQRLAGYGVAQEIGAGNLAAGVGFGMTLVALALIMLKAISGEFVGWGANLGWFALDAIIGLILLLFLRWLTDLALLPHARIADEVVRDRNVNAGLVEGALAVGIAAIILYVF